MGAGVASAEISQATLDSISTPDRIETSIGTLKFLYGAPLPETARKAYNYIDAMRGVDAFLKGISGASMRGLITGIGSIGALEAHQVMIMDKLMDSQSLFLTGNTSTLYVMPTLDLERDGPTVMEVPGGMLGAINDAWFRYVGDIGPAGPDRAMDREKLAARRDRRGKVILSSLSIYAGQSLTGHSTGLDVASAIGSDVPFLYGSRQLSGERREVEPETSRIKCGK